MSNATKVIYARPAHSNQVKGRKDVGMDGDQKYVCECYLSGADRNADSIVVGFGMGETADEARISAYSRMVKKLRCG